MLAALAVARVKGCLFVWSVQAPAARRAGVSDRVIAAVRDRRSSGLSDDQADLVSYAQQVVATTRVDQALHLRDQVLHSISHDLKNPLTTILSQAQILAGTAARAGTPADSPLRLGLERITLWAHRAADELDELVDGSRL